MPSLCDQAYAWAIAMESLLTVIDGNTKKTILIVEDDKNLARVLRIALSSSGYCLLQAQNGVEGMVHVREGKPDIILTDIAMPLMDGIEFCRRSREMSDAPIIVLSGEKDPSRRLDVLRAGADEFVGKPCNMRDLQATIQTYLSVGSSRSSRVLA